ncbi:FkbM family methyltransferase [Paenibacillus ehimensis]|uniref:FkbM family methyltransferase n=1 Tax=Paenibacillus ehimensis TaxID=79264 RepID=UPI003D26F2D8
MQFRKTTNSSIEERIADVNGRAYDACVNPARDSIDFIKMDIEGGEYHAFLGMETLLERQAVGKVAFELNPLMLSGHWDEFHRLLETYRERYAARFYKITNEGLTVEASLDELFAHGETETILMSLSRQE